jgi:clan AA aspartic protease (TIGR02281 family)
MIYLNRSFDVLTFKEDSGQKVYEILLILIVSSALASGKIGQDSKYLAIWAGIFLVLMADTGASHIVFSPDDAEKLGIETDELRFDRFYETANGTVRGSSIRIATLKIGEIHLREIEASVNEAEMRNSLLGMTFSKNAKG